MVTQSWGFLDKGPPPATSETFLPTSLSQLIRQCLPGAGPTCSMMSSRACAMMSRSLGAHLPHYRVPMTLWAKAEEEARVTHCWARTRLVRPS